MKLKKILTIVILYILLPVQAAEWSSKWIWQNTNGPANTWVCFRKVVDLQSIPDSVVANIGVDSKYWLWINGALVNFEGGVARGPSPGNTWYDEVDIKEHLNVGSNTIAVLVHYWGKDGGKGIHISSGKGGLIFQSSVGDVTISTDNSWKVKVHPAYDPNSKGGTGRLPSYNVFFDGQKALGDWSDDAWYSVGYDDSNWQMAVEKGTPPVAPWGDLELNYVGAFKNDGLARYENYPESSFPFVSTGDTIKCKMPFNKQLTPYLEIECSQKYGLIDILTDNPLNSIIAKYTPRIGTQKFEAYSWMSGHEVYYVIPAGVIVKDLRYRWTGVGEIAGDFKCDDPFLERLWWMGRNTLYICAHDNFMDCPDRERALWIGDVADQAGYLFYVMDEPGRQLMKKAIRVTMAFSKDKVFAAQAPGRNRELPTQSLQFISQGIWQYYFNTGDIETLEFAYPYVHDYLTLWPMIASGMSQHRRGDWNWGDWGTQVDRIPLQVAWYYLALLTARDMAIEIGKEDKVSWYNNRINRIKSNFDTRFWKNGYYSNGSFKDDRANALAILSGLAPASKYESILNNVLIPVRNASPHIEWMVQEAMIKADAIDESLTRMKERYAPQVNDTSLTTLIESFEPLSYLGSYNHAWNAPNTILSKYIVGITPLTVAWSSYQVLPKMAHMNYLKQVVPSVKGTITVEIEKSSEQFKMNLNSPLETSAVIGVPKNGVNIDNIKINGTLVWENGKYLDNVEGVTFLADDADYIKMTLEPGDWIITTLQQEVASSIINNRSLSAEPFVYPNPSLSGVFHLQKEAFWKVYTLSGTELLSGDGSEINLCDYPNGVYILEVNGLSVRLAKK